MIINCDFYYNFYIFIKINNCSILYRIIFIGLTEFKYYQQYKILYNK